jgi:aminopeptidase 2
MISRADTVNLSNMPAISEEVLESGINVPAELEQLFASTKNDPEKWKITKFETTPPMSTYIVAFANGHFEHLETSVVMPLSKKTVPLRIFGMWPKSVLHLLGIDAGFQATADNIAQAQFALDVKAAVLPLYEKIFDVEYPLPKLDTLVVRNPVLHQNFLYLTPFLGQRL